MMLRLASIVAAFAGLVAPCALQSAHAQLPLALESAPEFVREALDHSYGRALVAEFTNAVIESADPACLSEKRLDAAALNERGRDLFQRYGTRTMSTLQQNIDPRRYDAELAKRAGAKGKAELAALRKNPSVQTYTKTERPIRLAKVLDFVVEQFDRYVLLNRIQLKPISPLATGNVQLLAASPSEASEEVPGRSKARRAPRQVQPRQVLPGQAQPRQVLPSQVQRRQAQPSQVQPRQVQRYVALSEASGAAIMSAFNRDAAVLWGPKTFYSGVEDDLAEVCILPRGKPD
jgi:hypothetical protein